MRRALFVGIALLLGAALGWWVYAAREAAEQPAQEAAHSAKPARETAPVSPPPPDSASPTEPPATEKHSTPRSPAALAGVVIDAQGEPIEGARVAAYRMETGAERTATDAEGRFRYEDLPRGRYRVSAETDTHNPDVREEAPHGTNGITLTLTPRSTVRARAVDAITGAPLKDFQAVMLEAALTNHDEWVDMALNANLEWTSISTADGTFEITHVLSGKRQTVGVLLPGATPAKAIVPALEPGQTSDLITIRVEQARPLTVAVQDASGRPVRNAEVKAEGAQEAVHSAKTDALGEVRLLAPQVSQLRLHVAHPSFSALSEDVQIPPSRRVTVVMEAGATIYGSVRMNGKPLADHTVSASLLEELVAAAPRHARTDANGAYILENVRAGSTVVLTHVPEANDKIVEAPPGSGTEGRHAETLARHTVDVRPREAYEVNFDLAPANCGLRGQVELDGEPVRDAGIAVEVAAGTQVQQRSARTGEDGKYEVAPLMPGEWTVRAQAHLDVPNPHRRTRSANVTAQPGDTLTVNFDLSADAFVHGVISWPAGRNMTLALFKPDAELDLTTLQGMLALENQAVVSRSIVPLGAQIEGNVATAPYELTGVQPGAYRLIGLSLPMNALDGGPLDIVAFPYPEEIGVSKEPSQPLDLDFTQIKPIELRIPRK